MTDTQMREGELALAPAEILCRYLDAQMQSLSLEDADYVWGYVTESENDSLKSIARRLEAELAPHRIHLLHRSALRAVSLIMENEFNCTSGSREMRAKNSPLCELTTLIGGIEEQSGYFSTLWDAVVSIVSTVHSIMRKPHEVAFCELTKYRFGVDIDIEPVESDYLQFTLRFVSRCSDNDSEPVAIAHEELRRALNLLVTGLLRARPAMLVNNATVPSVLPPWLSARFNVINYESEKKFVAMDERDLFTLFVNSGYQRYESADGQWVVTTGAGKFYVDAYWIDFRRPYEQHDGLREPLTRETAADVCRRFGLFSRSIASREAKALSEINAAIISLR